MTVSAYNQSDVLYDAGQFYDGVEPPPAPEIRPYTPQFFGTRDELYRKFASAGTVSAEYVERSLSSIRGQSAILPVDWSNFTEHTFFQGAERKVQAAIRELIQNYPIGVSGSTTAGLTAENVASVDNYLLQRTGFEKYVLDYLGGATGNYYLNPSPTITAAATSNNDEIGLILLRRDVTNTLTGEQVTLSANLLSLAQSFDAGLNTLNLISGTAYDYDIVYFDDGTYVTNRILPDQRIEYVNRQSNMEEWMPSAYYAGDTEENLQKFVSTVAAIFDEIKLYINEFSSVNHISYDEWHRVPDGEIQPLLAKHFGYELIDTLLRTDIAIYLSRQTDTEPLYKVAYRIWNRVLNNLIYLYKRKGTLEALKALIRIYGLPPEYMQIHDYNFNTEPHVQQRVDYKNVRVLELDGSTDYVAFPESASALTDNNGQDWSYEVHVRVDGDSTPWDTSTSAYVLQAGGGGLGYLDFYLAPDGIYGHIKAPGGFLGYAQLLYTETMKDALTSQWCTLMLTRDGATTSAYLGWIDESSGTAVATLTSASHFNFSLGNNINPPDPIYIGSSAGFANTFFSGYLHESKFYYFKFTDADIYEHMRNYESVSYMNSSDGTFGGVVGQYKFKENLVLSGDYHVVNAWTPYISLTASGSGSLTATNGYAMIEAMRKETNITDVGDFADDNVDVYIDASYDKPRKTNILNIGFNPVDAINNDIFNLFGQLDMSDLMGDPYNFYGPLSGSFRYGVMSASASEVFSRYSSLIPGMLGTRININEYVEALENLAPVIEGIMSGIEQLTPVRTKIINRGMTIEPHILERTRYQQPASNFAPQAVPADSFVRVESYLTEDEVVTGLPFIQEEEYDGDPTSTRDYYQVTFEQLPYLQNYYTLTSPRLVGATTVQAFERQVYSPETTGLLVQTNRNFISSDSDIIDWQSTASGTINLVRATNRKVIVADEACVRIEPPVRVLGAPITGVEHYFEFFVNGVAIPSNAQFQDYSIPTKNGIEFQLKRRTAWLNESLGVLKIRFTNLLSGDMGEIPILYAPTEDDFGGTVEIQPGTTVIEPPEIKGGLVTEVKKEL